MESNNSLTAIIVIIAVLALIGFYVITNSDSLQIQTSGMRKLFGMKKKTKSTKKESNANNPATQLMTDWYIQIADTVTGEEWEDHYDINMTSNQEEYTIGRDPESDLCLPDGRVSWNHGAITMDGDGNFIYENRSESSGTINLSTRQRIDEIMLEEDLDLLLGNYQLRFHHTDLMPVLPPVHIEQKPEEETSKKKDKEKKKNPKTEQRPSVRRPSSNYDDKPLSVLKVGKMSDTKEPDASKDAKTKIYQ